jgi:hypothetical protein
MRATKEYKRLADRYYKDCMQTQTLTRGMSYKGKEEELDQKCRCYGTTVADKVYDNPRADIVDTGSKAYGSCGFGSRGLR